MAFTDEIDPVTGLPKKRFDPFNMDPNPKPVQVTDNPEVDMDFLGQSNKSLNLDPSKVDALDPRYIEPPEEPIKPTDQEDGPGLWDRFTLNTAEAQASLDRFDEKISNFGKKVESLTGIKTLSEFDGDNSIMGKTFRGTLYMGNAIGNSLERGAYSLAAFFGADVPRDANGLIRGQMFDEEGFGFYSSSVKSAHSWLNRLRWREPLAASPVAHNGLDALLKVLAVFNL
jgi:hypothetical protein